MECGESPRQIPPIKYPPWCGLGLGLGLGIHQGGINRGEIGRGKLTRGEFHRGELTVRDSPWGNSPRTKIWSQ